MEQPPASHPTLKERALADKRAREAREAAALRANLLRRKAQARSREPSAPTDPVTAPISATEG